MGECVLAGGACTRDVDCDDDNPCTVDRCHEGRCSRGNSRGTCQTLGGDGSCELGFCERSVEGLSCTQDGDCPAAANGCAEVGCFEGRCRRGAVLDGVECSTSSGQWGYCLAAVCRPDETGPARRCSRRWYPMFGWLPDCRTAPRTKLSTDEIVAAERQLEARLADQLRYDMKVALVELPGGGYNIVTHNRRDRRSVRGLCDPSFVAFNIANYTESTSWRSANLHVWLTPYRDGWTVPTRGSRTAVQRGKEASSLGAYGVVEVKAFRVWLEQAFKPLVAEPDGGEELETDFKLARLPERPDAGVAHAQSPVADAGREKPTVSRASNGEAELRAAWSAYERGKLEESRRALVRARKLGFHDPDLAVLLEQEP